MSDLTADVIRAATLLQGRGGEPTSGHLRLALAVLRDVLDQLDPPPTVVRRDGPFAHRYLAAEAGDGSAARRAAGTLDAPGAVRVAGAARIGGAHAAGAAAPGDTTARGDVLTVALRAVPRRHRWWWR